MASTNMMEGESSLPATPPRIFLLSYPRTTSNLFMQILSLEDQPDVVGPENGRYFFLPAMRTMRQLKLLSQNYETWTAEQKAQLNDSLQKCSDELQSFTVSAASNNQGVIVKEHVPFLTDPRALSACVHGAPDPRIAEDDAFVKTKCSNEYPIRHQQPGSPKLPPQATILPNDLLLTYIPTFLIRHPALAFPSYYRMMMTFRAKNPEAMQELESELIAVMTLKYMRRLFDWYSDVWKLDNGSFRPQLRKPLPDGSKPIVLDAGDITSNPEETMGQFCDIVGLDSAKLRFSWESGAQETVVQERNSTLITRSTLFSSTGVIRGNTSSDIKLADEVEKWKQEFGETVAVMLERAVQDAMPDYEYLKSHKLAPGQD